MKPINDSVEVGTDSTDVVLVEENEMPSFLVLCNNSANKICYFLQHDKLEAAVIDKGATLIAGAGIVIDLAPFKKFGRLYVNAISTNAGSTLGYQVF